jgi:hypothetical protein
MVHAQRVAKMMKLRLAAGLAIMLATHLAQSAPAKADNCAANPNPYTPIAGLPTDNYPICYEKPADPKYQQAFDDLQKRNILEQYSQFLAPLRLPHKLKLKAMQCTPQYDMSPFYSSSDRTLHFCYEFYQLVLNVAPIVTTPQGVTRESVISGTWAGVLLHETGHALFDMLDVPVFGREEDAADEVAAFIPLQFNKDVERTIIKGFAYFWLRLGQMGGDPPTRGMNPKDPNFPKDPQGRCNADPFCHYSEVHGTATQRFYNALCLGYGADREVFKDFIQLGWLPPARAANCAHEYQQLTRAFVKTILPFVDQDLMKKVQSSQWLQAGDLK